MNLDSTRLRPGDLVAAASGVLLIVSLYLTWYSRSAEGEIGGGSPLLDYSGWEALGFIDRLLLLIAVVAIVAAVVRLLGLTPPLPVNPSLVVFGLGAFAVLLVLLRLIDTPSGLFDGVAGIEVDRSAGIFVALVAALGVTLGGWLSWNGEGRLTAGPDARRSTVPVPPA